MIKKKKIMIHGDNKGIQFVMNSFEQTIEVFQNKLKPGKTKNDLLDLALKNPIR